MLLAHKIVYYCDTFHSIFIYLFILFVSATSRFILFSTEAQLLEEIKECEPLKALVTDIVRTAQEGGEEDCEYDEENVS